MCAVPQVSLTENELNPRERRTQVFKRRSNDSNDNSDSDFGANVPQLEDSPIEGTGAHRSFLKNSPKEEEEEKKSRESLCSRLLAVQ